MIFENFQNSHKVKPISYLTNIFSPNQIMFMSDQPKSHHKYLYWKKYAHKYSANLWKPKFLHHYMILGTEWRGFSIVFLISIWRNSCLLFCVPHLRQTYFSIMKIIIFFSKKKKKKKKTTTTIEEKHLSDIYCWIQRITKIQKYICHPGVKISSQGVNFHLSKCSPISEIPKRYSFCRPPIKANIRCNIKSMGRKVYSLCIACTS